MAITKQKILELATKRILKTEEAVKLGMSRQALAKLVESGELIRTARGLYISPDFELTENHSLAEAAKRFPKSVVCLLSALQYYGISLEMPHHVWIAIPRGSRIPSSKDLRLRTTQFSEPAFSEGIKTYTIEGVKVRIYSPAKTVADCFKFRNQITTAVAYEALKNVWYEKKATSAELVRYAKTCRVYNVMRPYLETLS